jgi:protein-tyrosine phosphatase/membrane-associated phospholipid phosphatase
MGKREPSFVRRHIPAALTSAVLGLWFIVVYGLGNYLASQHAHVGTWRYDWEKHIPFVPWLIVPYMSIDLFFVTAPFLCTSRAERMTLAKRIFFAITVAGIFFIVMPLRLVDRPQVDGVFGPIFRFLQAADQPFNLLPSLHITLRTILAVTFARHTAGHWRIASIIWFSLIGFSTVLVHQHHVVDVIGGFMLAALCFYLFPEPHAEDVFDRGVAPNLRAGWMYAGGAIVCTAIAFAWPWWSLWMLWPALALAIAAASSWKFGPAIYRKRDGRLPLSSRLVLAPLLAGQALSHRHYARQSRAHDPLGDRLIIGRRLNDDEAAALIRESGIVAVVDLTAEFAASRPFLALPYCNVQVADLTAPSDAQLQRAVVFVNEHAARGKVYVHCKAGYSRTAAVAGAALMARDPTLSADQVIVALRAARAGIVVRPEIVACLHRFHAFLATNGTQKDCQRRAVR